MWNRICFVLEFMNVRLSLTIKRWNSIFFGLWLIIFSFPALAEINKEAYANEAFRGLPAYFDFLEKQVDFLQDLSPSESQQFRLIHDLLREHVLSGFPMPSQFSARPLTIQFSRNPKLFQLAPGEPERSAVTSVEHTAPIFFNLRKLNRPNISFLDVIQLLIHEVGHKLGKSKDQILVDQLSQKIRNYLQRFYIEKQTRSGLVVQLLSLPFEVQNVQSMSASYLSKIHLFVVNENSAQSIPYDFRSHGREILYLGNYTAHDKGIGNFHSNRTYTVRDIELGPENNPLDMNLIVEIQNRLIYLGPSRSFKTGPTIGNQQMMIPQFKESEILPAEYMIAKAPVYGYYFQNKLAFNFIDLRVIPWEYRRLPFPILPASPQLVEENHREWVYELQFNNTVFKNLSRMELEIAGDHRFSLLILGKYLSPGSYQFRVPKNLVPSQGALVGRFVLDSQYEWPLSRVIDLLGTAVPHNAPTQVRSLSVMANSTRQPYKRNEKIESGLQPIELSLEVNFVPSQVRIRWIKGSEIYLENSTEDVPIGRYSRVVEETLSPNQFQVQPLKGGQFLIRVQPQEVYWPTTAPLTKVDGLKQKDSGLREINEIVLVTSTGQTVYYSISSNRKIYNNEYLRVKPTSLCVLGVARH